MTEGSFFLIAKQRSPAFAKETCLPEARQAGAGRLAEAEKASLSE
jgi:hypothetical protein